MKSHRQVVFWKALTINFILPAKGDIYFCHPRETLRTPAPMSTLFRLHLLSLLLKYFPTPTAYIFVIQELPRSFLWLAIPNSALHKGYNSPIPYILSWGLKTISKLHFIVREPETLTLRLHFLIHGLVPSSGEQAGKYFASNSLLLHPRGGALDW